MRSFLVLAAALTACAPQAPVLVAKASVPADTGFFTVTGEIAGRDAESETVTVAGSLLKSYPGDTLLVGKGRQKLRLELGNFGNLTADLSSFSSSSGGIDTWSGGFRGDRAGRIVLVRVDGVVSGSILSNDGYALILKQSDGQTQVVERVDVSSLPPELAPIVPDSPVPPAAPSAQPSPAPACQPLDSIRILMAVMTGELGDLGGMATAETEIGIAIGNANDAMALSKIPYRYQLGGIVETPGLPTRHFNTLLHAMQLGNLANLVRARDSLNADAVVLWMPHGSDCGLAYLLDGTPGGRPADAFAVVSRLCSISSWTLAHELGHLLGVSHDRAASAGEDPPPVPARPYGYGYRDPAGLYRDLMAYQCPAGECYRLPYYSTPAGSAAGKPLGIDYKVNAAASADAARTIRETGCTVAHYR